MASRDRQASLVLLTLTILGYVGMTTYAVINGRTWIDEVSYVIKSWWYVTGQVQPYSDQDATWYMPLYFYQLGLAQKLFGQSHEVGRTMSAGLGALSAVLVF